MNVHKNARQTPRGRERIVELITSGQTPKAVSEAVGVCPRTVRKWFERYRREGLAGLQDRSSRPHRLRRPTPQVQIIGPQPPLLSDLPAQPTNAPAGGRAEPQTARRTSKQGAWETANSE